MPKECIYCGSKKNLSYDHLLPKKREGPDVPYNVIMACRSCNSSKSDKCFYEWWFESVPNSSLSKMDLPPRIAEGKYLKLLYKLHSEKGTLDVGRADLERLCKDCDLGYLCEKPTLTVYCLGSILWKKKSWQRITACKQNLSLVNYKYLSSTIKILNSIVLLWIYCVLIEVWCWCDLLGP